jgi:hypothetical protein
VVQRHTRIHGQQGKKENKGFGERLALIAESKSVQMMGKLHLDLFGQEKYLLNQVEMKIKLRRSRDVFALTGVTGTFKNKIKDISLFVRKVQLSPNIRMGHVKDQQQVPHSESGSQSRHGTHRQHELRSR